MSGHERDKSPKPDLPAECPEITIAELQRSFPSWLVMWSVHRMTFTAFALFNRFTRDPDRRSSC